MRGVDDGLGLLMGLVEDGFGLLLCGGPDLPFRLAAGFDALFLEFLDERFDRLDHNRFPQGRINPPPKATCDYACDLCRSHDQGTLELVGWSSGPALGRGIAVSTPVVIVDVFVDCGSNFV